MLASLSLCSPLPCEITLLEVKWKPNEIQFTKFLYRPDHGGLVEIQKMWSFV